MNKGVTSELMKILVEQQKALAEQREQAWVQHGQALEQQAAQQEMLLRMVEQQKEDMVRHREEISGLLHREASVSPRPKALKPTLQKLSDDADIEHFLETFERIATQQKWPENIWATQLAEILTGKALAAYVALGSEGAGHYTRVKAAILHRYEVNDETRRYRFHSDKKDPEESYRSFVCRIVDSFDRWMKGQKLLIREVMI